MNPSGSAGATSTGLFIGCHAWRQHLAEIAIPSTLHLSETAALRQDCTDVTEGRLDLVDDMPNLGGALVYGGRLIVSAYGYYDADVSQTRSHFASSTDLAQIGDVVGPEQVGEQAGVVAGYMTIIPEEWQASLGGPALTGQCCIPIISRTSAGPAAPSSTQKTSVVAIPSLPAFCCTTLWSIRSRQRTPRTTSSTLRRRLWAWLSRRAVAACSSSADMALAPTVTARARSAMTL
ncbi:hypothetical protein [Caldilinea sp.]|uniref:hypothetical protein n=1 Tax=Caldilinea sp. TaxID=2293560 RepID=UPI00262F751F|nr:hypothetical protein [Caldilinea sp.]